MTNKTNPYELRVDLLQMAQEYLQNQYEANLEYSKALAEQSLKAGVQLQQNMAELVPKFYDFEDIVNKAKELYNFVSTK